MPGEYCIDKVHFYLMKVLNSGHLQKILFNYFFFFFKFQTILDDGRESLFSSVCAPRVSTDWSNTDILIARIVDPLSHLLSIICFLAIAIVYFVLPQLRDLVGNIITSISICLIVAQTADLVRTFTEFSSHVSFLVAGKFLSSPENNSFIPFQYL